MGYKVLPFSGLSAFPTTPADENGVVDLDRFGQLIERLKRDCISSIGVLGSTGCYMYLSIKERERALKAAIEAAGDTPVIASVGAMRTSDVLTFAKSAQNAGAKGLLIAPINYLPLTDNEVSALFEDVSNSVDIPVCFYNNPGTTGFSLSEDLLVKLANNGLITGVKNPPPDDRNFSAQLERLRNDINTPMSLGYSGDAAITGALRAGADAWYSVLAGTLPKCAIDLWNARNNEAELSELNTSLEPLWATFNAYGSIRVIYEISAMLGLGKFSLPRPLLPLDKQAVGEIEQALDLIRVSEGKAA